MEISKCLVIRPVHQSLLLFCRRQAANRRLHPSPGPRLQRRRRRGRNGAEVATVRPQAGAPPGALQAEDGARPPAPRCVLTPPGA
jgi:hypothetical protein